MDTMTDPTEHPARRWPDRLYFSFDEFQSRLAAVRESMRGVGIDVLCVTAPENLFYLTGYDGWSFYTPQVVAVAADEEEPCWIGREMDQSCARATTWLREENIVGYADEYVDSNERHPMDVIALELQRRGWGKSAIGLELDNNYFTARCLQRIRDRLPGAEIRDATNLVNWIRLIKSPRELEYVAEAAVIASEAMRVGVDAMEPGVRECDVAAEIVGQQIRGTGDFGGDPPTEVIAIPVGTDVSCPHLAWTDRRLEKSCTINLELGGVRRRYNAGISRSVVLGRASRTLRHLADATVDALEQSLAAIRPGVTASAVAETYNAALARYGESKSSRIGYSIGIGYPPTWIERTVNLRPGDTTVLQAGMTFHLMCGMWREADGFVQSETFSVTETGCNVLTRYPRGLIEKAQRGTP